MKKSLARKFWIAVLSVMLLVTMALAFAACGGDKKRINAPAELEEDIGAGTYIVPEYEVVNPVGVILYGYTVTLKSATDPNGTDCEIVRGVESTLVTLSGSGKYNFVYTTGTEDVKDATVVIDFADRTAPVINYDSSELPQFFIKGNYYDMPDYTISGDFDREKCKAKVYYFDAEDHETEVTVDSGRFLVDKSEGKYEIRIHLEDAAGNFNDYKYVRSVDGPETIVENTVLYFNEEFGARQVSVYEDAYKGEYVSKDTAGAHVYGEEGGAYRVTFTGVETKDNEAYIQMNVPAITDISDYKELEMYVYNDSDADIVMGSRWWNDQKVVKKDWTRLTWSVANWGGEGSNVDSSNVNICSVANISGTNIRFIFDYNGKIKPNGTFYLSSMRAVPREKSLITAGENVILNRSGTDYAVGDSVILSANEIGGKTVNCYYVDGTPISGDEFVATKSEHNVTVTYVDGALNKDNMTWGTAFNYREADQKFTESDKVTAYFAGNGDGVISLDVVGGYQKHQNVNQLFNLTFMLGLKNGIEIQINEAASTPNVCKWYYNGQAWGVKIADLSATIVDKFKNASEEDPVHVDAVKKGDRFTLLVDGEFLCSTSLKGLNLDGSFGYGYRREGDTPAPVEVKNAKAVIGATRTELFMESYKTTLNKTDVSVEDKNYYIGDEVTLTAINVPDGKMFSHFTVDSVRITGNTFTVTKTLHTVAAVFVEKSTLQLEGGITTSDGKTVYAQGATVKLVFQTPAGKVFDCFLVDDDPIASDTFVASQSNHVITVKYATSASDMTWGEVDFVIPTGGSEVKVTKLGNAEHWAVSYDITQINTNNQGWYTGVYIGGSAQLASFEMASWGNSFNLYGHVYAAGNPDLTASLSDRVVAILNGARASAPVTVTYVRQGALLKAYVSTGTEIVLAAKLPLDKFIAHNNYSDAFGYGWRNDFGNPDIDNIRFVYGESKTQFYVDTLKFIQFDEYDEIVTLGSDGVYTLPTAKVVNDEGNQIEGTVEVVSVKDSSGNSYTVDAGKITVEESGSVTLIVTYRVQGQSSTAAAMVTVQSNDGIVYTPTAKNTGSVKTNCSTVTFDNKKHGDDAGSLKLTINSSASNQDYGYLEKYDFAPNSYVELYMYTETSGLRAGCLWYGDMDLTANTWTYLRFSTVNNNGERSNFKDGRWILRFYADNVVNADIWISTVKTGVYASNQLNDLALAHNMGEWSTEQIYGGEDTSVDTSGALKVVANSGDVDLQATNAFNTNAALNNLADYDEVYFYVYVTESGLQAGTWWCNDTPLTANEWTKVVIYRDPDRNLNGGKSYDADGINGKFFKEGGNGANFHFRLQHGQDKTFYVTSLYGTPKTDA